MDQQLVVRVLLGVILVAVITLLFPLMLPVVAIVLLLHGMSLRRQTGATLGQQRLARWEIAASVLLFILAAAVYASIATGGQIEIREDREAEGPRGQNLGGPS